MATDTLGDLIASLATRSKNKKPKKNTRKPREVARFGPLESSRKKDQQPLVNRNDNEPKSPHGLGTSNLNMGLASLARASVHENVANITAQDKARTLGSLALNESSGSGAPSYSPTDIDALLRAGAAGYLSRAQNAAGIEYDPKISAINRLMGQTERRGKEGQRDITNMFTGLANDIKTRTGALTTELKGNAKTTADAYKALQTGIGKSADSEAAANEAYAQQQGFSTKGSQAAISASEKKASLVGQAGINAQTEADLQKNIETAASEYGTETATSAKSEGVVRTADLAAQVRDALENYGGQVADLQGAKGKAIRELTDTYRQQAFSNALATDANKLNWAQFGQGQYEFDMTQKQAAAAMQLKAQGEGATGPYYTTDEYKDASPMDKLAMDINNRNTEKGVTTQDYLRIIQRAFDDPEITGSGPNSPKNANAAGRLVRKKYNTRANFLDAQGWKQVNPDLLQSLVEKYWKSATDKG